MRIIPAIDIIAGQCVRLSKGEFATSKVYHSDPLEAALAFENSGLARLHLVDLDGARARRVTNWDVLERIASNTSLAIDFSGGISDRGDVEKAFDLGASQVAVGSLAVRQRETVLDWIAAFGASRIIIGADVRDGVIATHGWTAVSGIRLEDHIGTYHSAGCHAFLCTDVSRDGLLEGPATGLYSRLLAEYPSIDLIASGGVSSVADLDALRKAGCAAAIVGKAIYEERISLEELKEFEAENN